MAAKLFVTRLEQKTRTNVQS